MVPSELQYRSARPRITLRPAESTGLAAFPYVTHVTAPPYADLEPVRDLAGYAAARLRPGAVWVVKAATAPFSIEELIAWIHRLRAEFPAVPVALWLDDSSESVSIKLAAAAGALRVRALLTPDKSLTDELRHQLTTPHDLAADLIEWLHLTTAPLPSRVTTVIGGLIRAVPKHATMAAFLTEHDLPRRTVGSWFAACELPSPGRWFVLARLLPALLRIQREPKTPLLTIALQSGYGDHAALSHQVKRLFGIRPGSVRGTVGWEWLLVRFLGGAGQDSHR